MIFRLALRNTRLHFWKRLPVAVFLVGAMALLFIGNAVFSNTDRGLESTYRESLTGDLTVSARAENPFTLFGSDLPLVGEFFKNPTLPRYEDVTYRISRSLPEAQVLPLLIGAGKLSLGKFETAAPFFGARLPSYFSFFPGLKLVSGTVPSTNRPGIYLNSRLYAQVKNKLGRDIAIGESFLYAAALDSSFVLRELPFEGVFEYPVSDQLLERVVLIDDETARALNGYYGETAGPVSDGTNLTKDSLDDLFAEAEDQVAQAGEGLTVDSLAQEQAKPGEAVTVDPKTWNFLLLRQKGGLKDSVLSSLQADLDRDRAGVEVRNWRDSAGGNARIVWFLQWIFNVGLLFISLVASLIVMNSLSLSVSERTREIGTMRALGATRSRVGRLIGYETVLLVTGAGLVGIALGAFLLTAAAWLGGIPIGNPLLASLFGSTRFVPEIPPGLVSTHALLGLGLGVLSMVLPISKALRVAPVQAMARE